MPMKTVVTNKKHIKRIIQSLHVFLLFGILGFTTPLEHHSSTEIRRVSFASRADGKGIVIRLHAKAPLAAYREPRFGNDNKIELILFNARLSTDYRSDTPYDPVVDLSVKERNGHLVFSFALDESITVETAAYPDQTSDDLLVGVTLLEDKREGEVLVSNESADRGKKLPANSASKIKGTPVKLVKTGGNEKRSARKLAKKVETGHQADGSVPVSMAALTVQEKAELWTLDTIVIDAGHGGKDAGAVANGIREKDVNLEVALKVGTYLEKLLKVNVVYTRTTDEFVELQERGKIANQAGAKLFISIHANSAPYSSKVRGTETYILGLHRSEKAKEVMERENAVVRHEANPDQYDSFYQNGILQTLAFNGNLKMSEKLAGEIETQFSNRVHRQSRGVKQAGLIVLWAASMPAVLVELGYLTNRFEAQYLNSIEGQEYLASAIFRAVRDFKREYEKGLNISSTH